MFLEAIFWGVIPAGLAFASVALSLVCAVQAKRVSHWVAATFVVLSSSYALILLKQIFIDGAWPTYIPHVVVALVVGIVLWQFDVCRDKKKKPNKAPEPTP